MSSDYGFTPDPVRMVHAQVLRLVGQADADMVHLFTLPDGYNCHTDGLGIVVLDDVQQVDETAHSRELVKVNVFGPDYAQTRRVGRQLYQSLTQGITSMGLGVSRSRSVFFGAGPSYKPTGFVSTMSISVGMSKLFAS